MEKNQIEFISIEKKYWTQVHTLRFLSYARAIPRILCRNDCEQGERSFCFLLFFFIVVNSKKKLNDSNSKKEKLDFAHSFSTTEKK